MPKFFIILVYFFILGNTLRAAEVFCTHCQKKIVGNYLLDANKKPYCSKTCYSVILPKCDICKKVIEGPYRSLNNKAYCSDKCFAITLPKCKLCQLPGTQFLKIAEENFCLECMKQDKCSSCKMPQKTLKDHKDGRKFCGHCLENLIFDELKATIHYLKAVQIHTKILGKGGIKIPPMKFVNQQILLKSAGIHPDHQAELRGYFQETKVEKELIDNKGRVINKKEEKISETIYILNGLTENEILVTSLHELTHDWVADYYPGLRVAPLWLEEGFCQFITYRYCVENKLTKQLNEIKNSPDEVYGKGVNFFLEKFDNKPLTEVFKWLESEKYHIKPTLGTTRKE